MYRPEYLETLTVLALRSKILHSLKKDPPKSAWDLASLRCNRWLPKHLDSSDFTTLGCIETAVGKKEADEWMEGVLKESGLFKEEVAPGTFLP